MSSQPIPKMDVTTFQEYVDARYNLRTLCSADMILFMNQISNDKLFFGQIVQEYEKWREATADASQLSSNCSSKDHQDQQQNERGKEK